MADRTRASWALVLPPGITFTATCLPWKLPARTVPNAPWPSSPSRCSPASCKLPACWRLLLSQFSQVSDMRDEVLQGWKPNKSHDKEPTHHRPPTTAHAGSNTEPADATAAVAAATAFAVPVAVTTLAVAGTSGAAMDAAVPSAKPMQLVQPTPMKGSIAYVMPEVIYLNRPNMQTCTMHCPGNLSRALQCSVLSGWKGSSCEHWSCYTLSDLICRRTNEKKAATASHLHWTCWSLSMVPRRSTCSLLHGQTFLCTSWVLATRSFKIFEAPLITADTPNPHPPKKDKDRDTYFKQSLQHDIIVLQQLGRMCVRCTGHAKSSWQSWKSNAPKWNLSQEICALTS